MPLLAATSPSADQPVEEPAGLLAGDPQGRPQQLRGDVALDGQRPDDVVARDTRSSILVDPSSLMASLSSLTASPSSPLPMSMPRSRAQPISTAASGTIVVRERDAPREDLAAGAVDGEHVAFAVGAPRRWSRGRH